MLPATFVEGTLTDDPSLAKSGKGTVWAKFRLAAKEPRREGTRWVDGEPTYIDVVCFGKYAEHLKESAHKGDTVLVWGTIEQSHYERADGSKGSSYQITATSVGMSLRWRSAIPGDSTAPLAPADGEPPF